MTGSAAQKIPPYGAIVLRKEVIDEIDRLAGLMKLSREELTEKALLEMLEDYNDQLVADKAFQEWEASGKETISMEEVVRQLGLDR